MFCSGCGKEITGYRNLCDDCVKQGGKNLQGAEAVPERPCLWNPRSAALWGLLLSPTFACFLHWKNWRALDEEGEARGALLWVIGTALTTTYVMGMDIAFNYGLVASKASGLLPYFLYGIWYLFHGRAQENYLFDYWNNYYERKTWLVPIVLFMLCVIAIALALSFIIGGIAS